MKSSSINKRTYVFTTLALMVWGFLASLIAGHYYYLYNDLSSKTQKPIVHVNIGINYGNGTSPKWFNDTKVKAGDTLLNATTLVAKVKYTLWSTGAFVDSIDNVNNSGSFYWLWWMHTTYGWSQGQVASDRYIVGDNETYYWYYEDTSNWPPPLPP